jgi:hypothetical protein
MSNPATFDQAFQMLNLTRDAGASLEALQTLYSTGLLSDLLKAENPATIDREEFRRILGFDPSVFRTTMGGPESTDDIVRYLREINGFTYVNDHITQKNFPLTGNRGWEDEIVIHDPGCSFSEDEGFAILKQEGLLRPTYEHALRFARQHGTATTLKKKPFVIFLHKSWQTPDRRRRVLSVGRYPAYRLLYLSYVDRRFNDYRVLAGVRPRNK